MRESASGMRKTAERADAGRRTPAAAGALGRQRPRAEERDRARLHADRWQSDLGSRTRRRVWSRRCGWNAASARTAEPAHPESPAPLDELERVHILEVLKQVNGNRMAAARLLGISRRALYRRLERHHLEEAAPRATMGRRPS